MIIYLYITLTNPFTQSERTIASISFNLKTKIGIQREPQKQRKKITRTYVALGRMTTGARRNRPDRFERPRFFFDLGFRRGIGNLKLKAVQEAVARRRRPLCDRVGLGLREWAGSDPGSNRLWVINRMFHVDLQIFGPPKINI